MSLSAKERILKLRETEYKLQKLQDDLMNGNDQAPSTMSEFLSHHNELMSLPGSNRNSMPFRFSFEAKRYVETKPTQRLTLPPKMRTYSMSRLGPYQDIDESEKNSNGYRIGLAGGHRSHALRSLLHELDQQSSKMRVSFPKNDKRILLNKAPLVRGDQNQNFKRHASSSGNSKVNSTRGFANEKIPTILSKLSKSSIASGKSKKINLMWNNKRQLSETASTTTPSDIVLSIHNDKIANNNETEPLIRHDSVELRQSVAYALGTSNLMGVILPADSPQSKKRGPKTWRANKSTTSTSSTVAATEDDEYDNDMSAKEAVSILRRRKLPERNSLFPKILSPQERGLIGVEISGFEPQCAYFYRDRDGNYNPHLQHSKNVTESMKNAKKRRI